MLNPIVYRLLALQSRQDVEIDQTEFNKECSKDDPILFYRGDSRARLSGELEPLVLSLEPRVTRGEKLSSIL